MTWHCLAIVRPYDPIADARVPVRIASANLRSITAMGGEVWEPAMIEPPKTSIALFEGDFRDSVKAGAARIPVSLTRLRKTFAHADRAYWPGAPVEIYIGREGDAWPWTLHFSGRVSAHERDRDVLGLSCEVDTEPFRVNLLTAAYAGTGDEEGGADLKDTPKPLVIGHAKNVEPVLIDAVNNVYQFSAYGEIEAVDALFERASDFGASTGDYADYAALVAATIASGRWATCLAEGMIRLGAPAHGVITGDVRGHAVTGTTPRLTGEIIALLADLAGIDAGIIDSTSLDAMDTAAPYNINVLINEQTTFIDMARRLALPCNHQCGISLTGALFVTAIGIAGGATLILDAQGRAAPQVVHGKELATSPPYSKVMLGANRSWRVHTADEIAFDCPLIERGAYDAAETYRCGNIVSSPDQSRWVYILDTPTSGNAPPTWPTTSNAWWSNLTPPLDITDIADLADDNILSVPEKIQVLIPQQTALEAQYDAILARATSMGLSTTALTTAHDAWETYLEALDPAWDDTSASTPLVYDVGLTDALPGLSAPGSADWNTASAGNISDGTDVTEGGVDYRRLEDDDAGQSMSSRAPWTAGFTEGQALSIWMIVRKEGSTTAHSNLQLQADEATHAPTQAAVAEIQFNKATGAYNVGTGSGGVEDISGWFDGADELLVWATGTIPDSTPDNTDIRPSVAPARGSTAAWTALAASLGTLDLRGFMVATGTFDPETWLNAQGRDALRKRLADYREQLVLMQSTIDSIIAMSFLVTDDGGGGSTDIAEVSIPSSIDAFATTGFRDPGDGGGAMVRSIGTTAPAAGDYDPRLVPGESDTTVATEGGGTEGDGFYADASGTPRWFDIFIPTAPVNIMALGAKPFDSTLSGSDQLARRSLNTIAWRKAARMTAGGVAELLVPACDTPFEISFAAQLYNGHRVRIEGGLRNTRGDEIARYGAGADWSTTPYFSDSVLASGHHHTAHESYLWRGGNLITWSGFTPVYATNSIADTAGNIVRPVFGTLTGTSFEVEADDARVNPAYGKLFTSGILKNDGKMSRVGPGLRVSGAAQGAPLPIFPDAVADWPNESVNYDGHVSAGRIAVGQEVIVCVHDAYLQGVGNYDDDPYDPGYRYRGNGGTCFQWYIRERAIVTDVTGTTVTLDRELPEIEAWEAAYGNGIFIIPGNRPDIMESRSVLSGIYPQLIRDVRVFGDGYLECIERPDGGRGTTFNIRSGAADYHIELAKNVSDYGLGGNFFHDSSQKFTDVIALRKMADIACGCARLNIEFGTMRAPWTGSSSTSTALVVNEMSRAVRVRGKSIITAANVQGLRFNACNGADVDIDTWRRAAGGSTLAPILCGNQVLGQAEDGNSEEDSDGVIDQSAPIRDNRVRIGESVTPEASYYVQMTAGEAMTVEGRYYGAVTKDAALLRGADNHLQCWFENGSIRMPQDATSDNVIDTNVPVEGLIGFSKETVASARVNGREVFPGKTEDITMSGVLTGTGNFSDGETVTIGDRTYTFQATLTDVDGNVDIGADLAASLANLADAINLGSGAGTDYAASTTANETVSATSDATTLTVTTLEPTVSDYVISTTTTAADATWGGNRLSGTTLETGGGAVDVTIDMTADKTSSVTAEKVLRLTGGNGINLAAIANATPGISKTLAIVNANTDASTESITFDSEVFNGGSLASVAAGLTTLVTVDVAATGALAMVSARENVNLIAPGSNMLPDPSFAEGGGGTAYDPFAVDEDDEVLRNDEEVTGSQVAYEWDLTGLVSTETRYEVGILRRAGALGAFALRLAGVEVWVGPDEYGNQPSQLAALIETPSVLPSPCLLELVVSEATYPLKFDFGTVVRPFSPNSQFDDAYVREASEATGGSGSTTTAASAVSFTPGGGVTATDVQGAIDQLGWEVIGTVTLSGQTEVEFTGLDAYQSLELIVRGATASSTGTRMVQARDLGGSYRTASGDYHDVSTAGAQTAVTGMSLHGGTGAAARSGRLMIASNIAGALKYAETSVGGSELSHANFTSGLIDALRYRVDGVITLNAGSVQLRGRRRG